MYQRIFSSLAVIFLGLFSGYLLKKYDQKHENILPFTIDSLRKQSQRFALLVLIPIISVSTVWIVHFKSIKVVLLPLLGVFELLIGGVFALLISTYLKYSWQRKGSFILCGTFANVGGIGGLVCYMFLGERGYAYVPLYTLFISLSFFCVGLPLTKVFSYKTLEGNQLFYSLLNGLKDIYVIVAMISVIAGIILNRSQIPRPAFFSQVIAFLIPFTNYIILFSIGLGMRFSRIGLYLSECLWLSLIRFFFVPVVMTCTALIFKYHHIDQGILFKAIIILSAMPMANNSVIASSLYDLNLDLANSCYIFTTLALVVVIPLLYFVLEIL